MSEALSVGTVGDAVAFAISQALAASLPAPRGACFAAKIAGDDAVDDTDLQLLDENLFAWSELDADSREALALAYFDCSPDIDLTTMVYMGLVRGPLEVVDCVRATWGEQLTAADVASSLGVTVALDDLPPDLTSSLAVGVLTCWGNTDWWVDDVEIRLMQSTDLTQEQAHCVANAIVDTKGITYVINRRLATVPVWMMPPDELATIDLSGRCGVQSLEMPRVPLHASRGDCVAVDGGPFGNATPTPCDGPHNAEVLSVVTAGEAAESWPGYRWFVAEAQSSCFDKGLLSSDPQGTGWSFTFDAPTRNGWEAGDRDLTCLVGKVDESWEGPSGLTG